jgi:hypothetical protein
MPSSNAELIRRWNQSNSDPDTVREVVAPGFVAHMSDGDVHGADGWIAFTQRVNAGVHDMEAGSDEVIESGDLIGERWWIHGTREDGSPLRWRGITMHRVADGRLQEDWVVAFQEEH